MIAMKNKKKIAAWSSYWSEGNINSFPNLFAENYSGDIFRFWSETFTMLREHNRVLDICTGNGAIAILARDDVNRRNISCNIHAIDVAKIQSHELQDSDATFNNIKFQMFSQKRIGCHALGRPVVVALLLEMGVS